MFDVSKLLQHWNVLAPLQFSPWDWGFVTVGLFLTIWLIFWLRSYYREDADDTDETLEMLTQFRNLHQEGGLSDHEFRLIRSHLAKHVQQEHGTERPDPNAISASVEPQVPKPSETRTENQTPVDRAQTGDTQKSERMPDTKTE